MTLEAEKDLVKLLDAGFAWTGERVARVAPDQLDTATPCTNWNLRALLNHALGAMKHLAEAADGEPDPSRLHPRRMAETDVIGAEPAAAYQEIAARALAVWHTPGVFERTCALPFGAIPGSVVAGLSVTDAVVHGWDISRATGERADIPTELAEPLLDFGQRFVTEQMRGTAFGAAVAVDGGSASDRLVAFLGRTP